MLRLGAGALIGVPLGVLVLTSLTPELFRYAVSAVDAGAAGPAWSRACAIAGPVAKPLIYATGGFAGLFGGAVGLPGPPVILLYMASAAAGRGDPGQHAAVPDCWPMF